MATQVMSKLYPNWKIQSFPANWIKYGITAGPIRNLEMIKENPDLVLAFHVVNAPFSNDMICGPFFSSREHAA
jgi:hypothetical protein